MELQLSVFNGRNIFMSVYTLMLAWIYIFIMLGGLGFLAIGLMLIAYIHVILYINVSMNIYIHDVILYINQVTVDGPTIISI